MWIGVQNITHHKECYIKTDGQVQSPGSLTSQIYQVDIECCDDVGYNVKTLFVDVRPAPSFTNLPATVSIVETTAIQTNFYQVTATNNGYSGTTWSYSFDTPSYTFQIDQYSEQLIFLIELLFL